MSNPFDDLRALAADLEYSVPTERARFRVARAMEHGPSRPRRAVVALATAGLLTISNVALAAVADPAAPGDALYGIDRAYERVQNVAGFDSHAAERLQEAVVMAERGRASDVLSLVQEALTEVLEADDPVAAVENLKRKANLGEDFEKQLAAVVDAANRAGNSDPDFSGQDVANLARELGRTFPPANSNRPGNRP